MRLFDLLYYTIFQLSRKGTHKDHHENTKGTLAFFVIPYYLIFIYLVISPLIDYYIFIRTEIMCGGGWILSYYLTSNYINRHYGKGGDRNYIIKEFDKISWFRNTSKYFDTFLLWIVTLLFMAICVILFWKVKKLMGQPI